MPSSRSNGCAVTVVLFATFLDTYYRRLYSPVIPYLLDERSSTRLGSVKSLFRPDFPAAQPEKHRLQRICCNDLPSEFSGDRTRPPLPGLAREDSTAPYRGDRRIVLRGAANTLCSGERARERGALIRLRSFLCSVYTASPLPSLSPLLRRGEREKTLRR